MEDSGWEESDLFCTCCDQVVAQKTWPNGFLMMRCHCIKKAGHFNIMPARSWIDKECRDDIRMRNGALLSSYSTAYFD